MFASVECTEAAEAALFEAARAAAPCEFAAVLGGCVRGENALVRRIVQLPNTSTAAEDSFAVDGVAFAQCEHELRQHGETFLGFVHSHPKGGTAPSVRDRQQLWTGCLQMITDGHSWQAFALDEQRAVRALASRETAAEPTSKTTSKIAELRA